MRHTIILLLVLACLASAVPAAAQGTDPMAVLNSGAPLQEKQEACRLLSIKGGPEAVAVLEPLLTDNELAHMARMALEPMACPEAGAALRAALGKTTGLLKAGVIGSLAARGDAQAVPELAALLADGDPVVAQAAASALGYIATPEAAEALKTAVAKPETPAANLPFFCEGLLDCADALGAANKKDLALPLYDGLVKGENTPAGARCAALRGAALLRGGVDALPPLVDALKTGDQDMANTALRTLRELGGGDDAVKVLADALPGLDGERKLRLISLLGDLGGKAAGPALFAEARTETGAVRIAALGALTRTSYAPVLELAGGWLRSEDAALAAAARNCVSFFPGKEGDELLLAMVKNDDTETRRLAVELIGKGGLESPVALLLGVAQNDAEAGVRAAALAALRNHTTEAQMPALLGILLAAPSPEEMSGAESALAALCVRRQKTPAADIAIREAVYGDLPDGPAENVTEKVARIVAAGAMTVEASNANFGEPAPGKVKKLRVDYTVKGSPATRTAAEGEVMTLAAATVPAAMVDAFCGALEKAQGGPKLAMLRLLGATGSAKALEKLQAAAGDADAAVREAALRGICEWPTVDALPAVMDLAMNAPDPTVKTLARRGAVRMAGLGQMETAERVRLLAGLMENAANADEKKLVLSGLAQVPRTDALELVLRQFGDETVKAEAVQAAVTISKGLGKSGRADTAFAAANGLAGWQGDMNFWRFGDGAITGGGREIPKNQFLWLPAGVRDFYLAVDVKLDPPEANAGIQFRSKKADDSGQALGYQADIGQDYWGRLYHEHGRGKLDWSGSADKAVKPGDWNRYEILAVGPAMWLIVNGTLGAACLDFDGEREGQIALQIHSGPPQTVQYRPVALVHDPDFKLVKLDAKRLFSALAPPAAPQP